MPKLRQALSGNSGFQPSSPKVRLCPLPQTWLHHPFDLALTPFPPNPSSAQTPPQIQFLGSTDPATGSNLSRDFRLRPARPAGRPLRIGPRPGPGPTCRLGAPTPQAPGRRVPAGAISARGPRRSRGRDGSGRR